MSLGPLAARARAEWSARMNQGGTIGVTTEPRGLWKTFERFGDLADRDGDDDDERQRHRFLLITGVSMSFGGLVWGTGSFLFGLFALGMIPFGYTLITIVNFLALWRTKNFAVARSIQVLISLLLPFLFQWGLGGFTPSGAMMIWAMLALVCALSFESKRASVGWLVFYLALTAFSGAIDPYLTRPARIAETGFGPFSFGINIATVSGTVFALTLYFLHLRDQANAELARKNQQIVSSQQALIRSEKMAALGQLVAGVAHELNTPLGAIRASVSNLVVTSDRLPLTLPSALASATAEERALFDRLIVLPRRGRPMSSKEERAARRALSKQLEAAGVPGADLVAEGLVELGWSDDPASVAPLLSAPSSAALLDGARQVRSLRLTADNIQLAAERASKIVFALKSYAHPGSADGAPREASVAENLDTVTTLYQNQIKQGVQIVRDYADPGLIVARHDELNQVWTNLLHNALQAMNNRGRITLSVRREGDRVRVGVEDDGPGIAPEHLPMLFEPFFTTKAQGEGTGLGLSICGQIVDEHGGTLTVESAPGRTLFTVALPAGGVDG